MPDVIAKPDIADMVSEVMDLAAGAAIGATLLPGFLLCVPALLLGAFFLAIPVIAAALIGLAGLAVAAPFLLIRMLMKHRHRRPVLKYALTPETLLQPAARRHEAPADYVLHS